MDLNRNVDSLYWRQIKVPKGLPQLLNIFLREAIRQNPPDIHGFLYELANSLVKKRDADLLENPEDFECESSSKEGEESRGEVKTPLGTIREESMEVASSSTKRLDLSKEPSEESHLEIEPQTINREKIKKKITFSIDENSESDAPVSHPADPAEETLPKEEEISHDYEGGVDIIEDNQPEEDFETLQSFATKFVDEVCTKAYEYSSPTTSGATSPSEAYSEAKERSGSGVSEEPSEETTEMTESFESVVRVTLKNSEDSGPNPLASGEEATAVEGQGDNKSESQPEPGEKEGIQLLGPDQTVEETNGKVINQQAVEEITSGENRSGISSPELKAPETPIQFEVKDSQDHPQEKQSSVEVTEIENASAPNEEAKVEEIPDVKQQTITLMDDNEPVKTYSEELSDIPDVPPVVKRRSKSAQMTKGAGKRTGVLFGEEDLIIGETLKELSQEESKLRSKSAGSQPSKAAIDRASKSEISESPSEEPQIQATEETTKEEEVKEEIEGDVQKMRRAEKISEICGSRSPTSLEEISAALDEEEMNAAAVKIQSVYRGFQTRKTLGSSSGGGSRPSSATGNKKEEENISKEEKGGQSPNNVVVVEEEKEDLVLLPESPITPPLSSTPKSLTASEIAPESPAADPPTQELNTQEEPSEQDGGNALNEAATRIQASYRGFQTRKELAKLRSNPPSTEGLPSPLTPTPSTPNSEHFINPNPEETEQADNMHDFTPETSSSRTEMKELIEKEVMDNAATRIQAQYRGFKVRKSNRDKDEKRRKSPASSPNKSSKCETPTEPKSPPVESNKADLGSIINKEFQIAEDYIMSSEEGSGAENIIMGSVETNEILPGEEELALSTSAAEEAAATKIQANFRGYATRKRMGESEEARKKSPSILQEDNKSKLNSEAEAAVKIQSGVRGFLVRQRVKKHPEILPRNAKQFTEKKRAAVKIQATVRGFLTRRRLAKAKQRRKSSAVSLTASIRSN